MRLVYLASPYSHPDADVREHRFNEAVRAAAIIIRAGDHVFSPIAHSHPIAVAHDLPLTFDYWVEYDRRMISHCDRLTVLMLDGWERSVGVTAEIAYARTLRKPVDYMALTDAANETQHAGQEGA